MSGIVERRYRGCYVAIPLPGELQPEYAQVIGEAKMINPRLRAVNPNNPHVTLLYVGSVCQEDFPFVSTEVEEEAKRINRFDLGVGGMGFFTNEETEKAEVLYLSVRHPNALMEHYRNLRERLGPYVFTDKVYADLRAHLTVGLINDRRNDQMAFYDSKSGSERLLDLVNWRFSVEELVLFGKDRMAKDYQSAKLASFPIR